MKIGLSYSRCVRDIVDGNVDFNEVLVIITRTNFDPTVDEEWKGIWNGYGGGHTFTGSIWSKPEWAGYGPEFEEKFREVSVRLMTSGRLHQPRKFGANPVRRPEIWLETFLPPAELKSNPLVKDAWDKFQTLAALTGVEIDKDYY